MMKGVRLGADGAAEEEFNTNITDKDERKRLRKKRIEKRHSTETKGSDDNNEAAGETHRTGGQQVSDSLYHLDRRKHTGLQDVTEIRVRTDNAELKRRMNDEEMRRDRLDKLQKEAISSAKANAAIDMKWQKLQEKEIPQELHQEIELQMVACRATIKSKDDLIKEFQRQLRVKDEEYVRTLRQQSEDVTELLVRIRREFVEMQAEYDRESESIEEAYNEERHKIIADYSGEIEAMFDLRRQKEVQYKEAKQKREDQYQKEVEELITKGADQYNKLKIDLEKNIQTLKEQLEEIRATYQLNTEKLDYNYRVLTELDVEKNAELARYKRRLAKLKDQLNQLVTRYADMEGADSKTNNDLSEDYRSLTRKYKELQAKFRHFEVADSVKYDDVWAMHEEEVKGLVDQLLKADKIIAEQQLGWKWRAPDMNALQAVLGRGAGNVLAAAAAVTAQQADGADGAPADGAATTEEGLAVPKTANSAAAARIRGMLQLLASEAGFLVNTEVQEQLDSLPVEEANLVRAESMLKALGVKNQQRLNALLTYFFKDPNADVGNNPWDFDPLAAKKEEKKDEEEVDEDELLLHYASEDINELKDMIRPEQVISAVKSYIEDVSIETGGAGGAPGGAAGGTKKADEEARIGQKRLNSMRAYWNQLSQVVSDDTVEVWRQLERNMVELKELLSKREKTVAEVDSLSRKNVELKRLLNQYLGDPKVNNYMMVPPAQVMKVREVAVPRGAAGAAIGLLVGGGTDNAATGPLVRSKANGQPDKTKMGGKGAVAGIGAGLGKKGAAPGAKGGNNGQILFSKTS